MADGVHKIGLTDSQRERIWYERVPGFQWRARMFYTQPPLAPGSGRSRRSARKPPRRYLFGYWLRSAAAAWMRRPLPLPVPGEPSHVWVTPLTCPLCARIFSPADDEVPPRDRFFLPGAQPCPRCIRSGRDKMWDSEVLVQWAGAASILDVPGMGPGEAAVHLGADAFFPPPACRLAGVAFWSRTAVVAYTQRPGHLFPETKSSHAGPPGLSTRQIADLLGIDTSAGSAVWLAETARAIEREPSLTSRLTDTIGGTGNHALQSPGT